MFEIQIRSILEHAWAENEHELFYKSGVVVSPDNTRNYAAVAGTLELLDREFERLRSVVNEEVETRLLRIQDGSGSADTLDTAGVVAILRILAPNSPDLLGHDLSPNLGASVLNEAFRAAGLTTANAVKSAFERRRFTAAAKSFAAANGLTVDEVSHMAMGALLAATQDDFPLADFPDLLSDVKLVEAIKDSGR